MPELTEWDSFYVIVGSAAGALIGLQFVVITLIAERPPLRAAEAGPAFATRRSLISAPCCFCQLFYALPGERSSPPQLFGVSWASVESCTPSSWLGACECKPYTAQSSRTGCFMFC